MHGDAKPVSVIEDTSVNTELLGSYIEDFNKLLARYQLKCVYHAHISVGELHLRPILDLKKEKDVELFHTIAKETAMLVKKYRGSLSGEHGDGRLRGEFIPVIVGEEIYEWFKELKNVWDPDRVFNNNKITDTPKMNTSLRYVPGKAIHEIDTIFDFSKQGGYLRAIEKCNGSGDCRKTELIGGAMCPSYMASRDEYTTTRARANILREYLTNPENTNRDFWDQKEIYNVLDLCLSCKACKSECPSSVDMAKLKAEFLQHYYDKNGIPLRARAISYITSFNSLGSLVPGIFNFFVRNKFTSGLLKRTLGFAEDRTIPLIGRVTVRRWARRNLEKLNTLQHAGAERVVLFLDEFTNYNDTEAGIKTIKLLSALGYRIQIPDVTVSGRTFISKGLIRTAKKKATKNVRSLTSYVSDKQPLVGVEPSAILSFRDEYPELVDKEDLETSQKLARNSYMLEEFILREIERGNIKKEMFTREKRRLKFHGHCQQKAIATTRASVECLSFPENYEVEEIPSGCCGMAGSFGYEKEHYDLSQKVGELVLFPAVRESSEEMIIVAAGTSCRHQIVDGTGRRAFHPGEVLFDALDK
jgi:Fe-S oxidoreductase